jgi:DNA-binding transcriptional LysR family regulator
MDRIESMQVFVRVVELGGFAAAAREAAISATMAAKHVQALETRMHARLLHRTTRSQSLTEAGKLYYDRCKKLLAELDSAEASISELRATPRGILRITAPVSFGSRALVPALADLARAYPEIQIDLTLSDRTVDLVDEGFEAALRVGKLADSQLIARPLRPYRSLLCASPEYLSRAGRPQTPQDLQSHDCLGFAATGTHDRWRLIRGKDEQRVTFTPKLRVNNGEALRQAALAGLGIVAQPEILLADDMRDKRLVRVLPQWSLPERPLHIVYVRDRQATPKLRCFVEFVTQRFS